MIQEDETKLELEPNSKKATIITVPEIAEKEQPFLSLAQEHFQPEVLTRNLLLLVPLLHNMDPNDFQDETQKEEFITKRDLLFNTAKSGRRILSSIPVARETKDILATQRPNAIVIESNTPVEVPTLQVRLQQELSTASGDVVVISSSHVSTYSELRAALIVSKEIGSFPENGKVGLVIFDEHTDFYRGIHEGVPAISRNAEPDSSSFSSMTQGQQERAASWYMSGIMVKKPLDIAKRNFLIHLLEENVISSTCIIGPSEKSARLATNKAYSKNATHDYYVDRTDKITILNYEQYINRDTGALNRSAFLGQIKEQIRAMKQKGMTHIIFSVDLDVLRSEVGYTGFDYNVYAVLVNLGLQNIQLQIDEFQNNVSSQNLGKNAKAEKLLELIDSVFFNRKDSLSSETIQGNVKPKDPGGLPAGFIGQSIEAIKEVAQNEGVTVGIQLPFGRFMGDVVELNGRDVKERTTKVALAIADRMSG